MPNTSTNRYFYQVMGMIVGPLTATELKRHAAEGKLTPDTLIRHSDQEEWQFAGRFNGLFKTTKNTRRVHPDSEQPVAVVFPEDESTDSVQSTPDSRLRCARIGALICIGGLGLVFVLAGFLANSRPSAISDGTPDASDNLLDDLLNLNIVEERDLSLAGRKRIVIRVVVHDRGISEKELHSALLHLAQRQSADAVTIFAYWPGDDWHFVYTAGKLEWGKNGGGWASTERLPPEGKFVLGHAWK